MEENKIKLAVVDDDEILTQLLANFLSTKEEYEVVFGALDGSELLNKLKDLNQDEMPDIIILDLRMKKMDGIDTIPVLKSNYTDIKIIVISSHYQLSFLGYLVKNGINAFMPKSVPPNKLVEVINSVYNKGFYFTDDQIKTICSKLFEDNEKPVVRPIELSEREKKVLHLICYQFTADEIAEKLFLSKRTIEGHRKRLLEKTGMKNTAGLVVFAIHHKLVDIDELGISSSL
jgi:DNA-binding NarL/FixJ family response regulator